MAGYIRQSTFVDGDTITAALFNNEYNQLVNAFSNTSGHKHDGTTAEGPVIGLIGDAGETSPNNKVLIDTTNNYIEFYIEVSSAPVQQIYIADGAIIPVTDNDIDLGTSSLEFKDIYIDGTATIDTLTVDEAATVGTTLGVTGATTLSSTLAVTGTSTLTGNVTTTNDLSVGGNLTVTGNATISGNLTFGDADTDSINLAAEIDSDIIPNTDGTYDLGSATKEWQDLYIDGTANIDSLVADTADINAGTIDNTIIGGTTAVAGSFTTATATTGNITNVNATTVDTTNIEVTNIKAKDGTASASIADLTGVITIPSSVLTTTDINGGTIDGATIATSDITVGAGKTLNVSAGTLTLADNQISGDKVEGGTIAATTVTTLTSTTGNITNVNATTVDSTNLEVTNLKAKDGTAAGSIADLTGVVTLASSVLTTTDINGGTIDGATIGGTTAGAVTFTDLSDGTITIAGFADEDNMVSDSATLLPTQQSVKAYVDSQVTAQDLDFQGDSGGALSIDLDSESLTIAGGTGIDTTGATNTLTVAIDSTVATLTGTQTLTNKTLTSPVLNTGVSGTAILDEDNMVSDSATQLATQQSIKAYVDSQVGGVSSDVVSDTTPQLGGDLDLNSNDITGTGNINITGDITISDSSPTLLIKDTDGTNTLTKITNINGNSYIGARNDASDGQFLIGGYGGNTFTEFARWNGNGVLTQKFNLTVEGTVVADGLTVDTSTLVVDATNNRVGIGTDSPDTIMEIRGADPVLTVRDTETGVANANATLRLAESGASDSLGSHFDVGLGNNQILTFGFSNDGTAATEQMKLVGSTGNLVLTTNPSSLYFGDTSSGSFVKGTNTGGYLILGTNNTERARLTTTGLGIGTTTADLLSIAFDDSIASDYTAFDIDINKASGSAITNLKGINVDMSVTDHNAGVDVTNLYGAYINNSISGAAASIVTNWYGIYIPAADADRTSNPVSAYFGDSVGIGVASPTATLDVDGTIKLDGNYPTGTGNVALGDNALDDSSLSGDNNTAIGNSALTLNTTGYQNTAVGSGSLVDNTTGYENTGVGMNALGNNTTGFRNVAMGQTALAANTTGTQNVALGQAALGVCTTGGNNTAVGRAALNANTADNNTAIGKHSMLANTSGTTNVAVGYQSMAANTTASQNTAVGSSALTANTTGADNVALGHAALNANTTASDNTAVGKSALEANTTGIYNTAVGSTALNAVTTGSSNTAIGFEALKLNTAAHNTAIGTKALAANTTGNYNTAIGRNSLQDNTTGATNVAVGHDALGSNTTSSQSTAVGIESLRDNTVAGNTGVGFYAARFNTTGVENTALGRYALYSNTTGSYNTAIGNLAQQSNSVTDCIAIGTEAMRYNSGNRNIGIGNEACRVSTGDDNTVIGDLAADSGSFTGSDNVFIGNGAATRASSSDFNVCIGKHSADQLTTGDDNTFVGYDSGDTVTTGFQNTIIGSRADASATIGNATALGYGITVTATNNVFIGNTSVSAIKGQVAFSTYSDERIKREIEDSDLGLEFIKDLKPRKYKRVAPKDYPEEFLDKNKNDLSNPDEVVDGLIAQEVKQTMDKLGVSFSGWDEDENTTKQSLEYATFVPALIKSIQELSSQVDELKQELQTLKGE